MSHVRDRVTTTYIRRSLTACAHRVLEGPCVYGSRSFRKGLRWTRMEKAPAERSVSPAFPDDEDIRPTLQTALLTSDPDFRSPSYFAGLSKTFCGM
jgi:hypothetical protein